MKSKKSKLRAILSVQALLFLLVEYGQEQMKSGHPVITEPVGMSINDFKILAVDTMSLTGNHETDKKEFGAIMR